MSESLRSLTKNERMSESLVLLSESLICSFFRYKQAIHSENRWANSQPCSSDTFPVIYCIDTVHNINMPVPDTDPGVINSYIHTMCSIYLLPAVSIQFIICRYPIPILALTIQTSIPCAQYIFFLFFIWNWTMQHPWRHSWVSCSLYTVHCTLGCIKFLSCKSATTICSGSVLRSLKWILNIFTVSPQLRLIDIKLATITAL